MVRADLSTKRAYLVDNDLIHCICIAFVLHLYCIYIAFILHLYCIYIAFYGISLYICNINNINYGTVNIINQSR